MYSVILMAALTTQPGYHERHVLHARGAGCNGTHVRETHHIRGRAAGCGGNQARAGCQGGYQRSAPAICPCPAPQAMPRAMQGSSCPNCPDGVGAAVVVTPRFGILGMLQRHNEIRQARGLRTLVLDDSLSAQAQAHSDLQARSGRMFHASPVGPNECVSQSSRIGYDHVTWLSITPPHVGHEKRMLDPAITKAGYGVAQGPGGEYMTFLAR